MFKKNGHAHALLTHAVAFLGLIAITTATHAAENCQGVENWNPLNAYVKDKNVIEDRVLYTAKWWSRGAAPSIHHGPWQEWKRIGQCAPDSHDVQVLQELMITNLAVVEDPVLTGVGGAFTFEHLIVQMMPQVNPTAVQKSDFVMNWLSTFLTDQVVNGDTAPERIVFDQLVIQPWLQVSGNTGLLDLSKAPFRLLAIAYRPDLMKRDAAGNVLSAGEARFVFSFVRPQNGLELPAKIIFEYELAASSQAELNRWVDRFHGLGALPAGSREYVQQVANVTSHFTRRNAIPNRPNGSALNQLRTNEIAFGGFWELREYKVSATSGQLEQVVVAQNPAQSVNNTQLFADFVNMNEAQILDGSYSVPLTFQQTPFAGAASPAIRGRSRWNGPGIVNSQARHIVSLNTCNGCHTDETLTRFNHVMERAPGQESFVSDYLMAGINDRLPLFVRDPVSGERREFHELLDRKVIFTCLIQRCDQPAAALIDSTTAQFTTQTNVEQVSDLKLQFDQLMQQRKNRAH
jgi:hypothetical protein